MQTSQPTWKLLYKTDETAVFTDSTGTYPAEIEIAYEYFDARGKTKWQIHRWPLERFKWHTDNEGDQFLVPIGYDATWPYHPRLYKEWFLDDIKSVADSCGVDLVSMLDQLTSDDPAELASVYSNLASYHGADNFDSYPRTMTDKEFQKYTKKNWV